MCTPAARVVTTGASSACASAPWPRVAQLLPKDVRDQITEDPYDQPQEPAVVHTLPAVQKCCKKRSWCMLVALQNEKNRCIGSPGNQPPKSRTPRGTNLSPGNQLFFRGTTLSRANAPQTAPSGSAGASRVGLSLGKYYWIPFVRHLMAKKLYPDQAPDMILTKPEFQPI